MHVYGARSVIVSEHSRSDDNSITYTHAEYNDHKRDSGAIISAI